MSRVYTYSFEDTTVVLTHPGFGTYYAYGTGIGTLSVGMAEDISSQEAAADLTVIISKHAYKHGSITFNVLQSSDFNRWLNKFVNFLENSNTDQWALATISIINRSTGDSYIATGVCPQKRADNKFEAKAGNRDWTFLAANITNS